MLSINDLVNILLPVLSHWMIWLVFFIVSILFLLLYAYPYLKKPRKEVTNYHKKIPITGIISLYIFTKMLEGVLYEGSILKVDAAVNNYMQALPVSWIYSLALFITNFGSTLYITILFIIALAVLVFKKRWRFAILSIIAILGAIVLQFVIKGLVQRTRPVNLLETGYSFPSGHAMTAIVFVSLLIYSFRDDFKNKIVKYVLITAFSAFFISVSISRIVLHVHWFSDVVAGITIILFWFMCVILVERSIPSAIPAIKKETKEAKPIVSKEVTKAVAKVPEKVTTAVAKVPKKVVSTVAKVPKKVTTAVAKVPKK